MWHLVFVQQSNSVSLQTTSRQLNLDTAFRSALLLISVYTVHAESFNISKQLYFLYLCIYLTTCSLFLAKLFLLVTNFKNWSARRHKS